MSLNYDIVTASVFCIGTCKNGFQTPWSHKDPLSWGPDLDSSRLRTALSSPFSEPTNAPRTPRLSPRKSQWIQEIIVWSRVDYTVWTHSKETWSTLRKWEMHTNSKTANSRTCRQVTHINLKTESKCHRSFVCGYLWQLFPSHWKPPRLPETRELQWGARPSLQIRSLRFWHLLAQNLQMLRFQNKVS